MGISCTSTFVFILKQHYKSQNNEHFHGMSSPKYKLRSIIVCVHKSTFSIQKCNLFFSPRQLQGLIRALFPDFSYHYSSWLTQLLGKTTAYTAEPPPQHFPSPSLDSLSWSSPIYIGNHEATIWRFPQKIQQAPSYQQLVPTPSFPYGPFVRCFEMRRVRDLKLWTSASSVVKWSSGATDIPGSSEQSMLTNPIPLFA